MNNDQAAAAQSPLVDFERRALFEGMRAYAPAMPGIGAWGAVTGMAMVKAGLTIPQALGMSFLVFAGSAQLAALPLIVAAVPIWLVFLTAMVVNLRFVIFSAAIGPHLGHLPWHRRLWHGYFNSDVTMGLFPQRFPAATLGQTRGKLGFYAGIGYLNWLTWQTGSVAGILLGSQIPESWGLGFAGTLALLAVTIPLTVNLAALAGVLVAAVTAVVGAQLPYRLGLLMGVIFGMIAAMAVDAFQERRKDVA